MMKIKPLTLGLSAVISISALAAADELPVSAHDWALPDEMRDLTAPEYRPADAPAWATEDLPEWIMRYVGKNAAPEKFAGDGVFGSSVKGIDRYQANWFIWYRPETASYLYGQYTPLEVGYVPGTLPTYDSVAAEYTQGLSTDTEKALALLMALPEIVRHPGMPPVKGAPVAADRNLDDEALLASGGAWCNEQARVFIRLCQVLDIPARMIHLFGQNHTVAEFYADGRWVMADASIFFVARDEQGNLLSAADCHDGADGQRAYALAKRDAMHRLADMTDEQLGYTDSERAQRFRRQAREFDADELAEKPVQFGVINTPLPPAGAVGQR